MEKAICHTHDTTFLPLAQLHLVKKKKKQQNKKKNQKNPQFSDMQIHWFQMSLFILYYIFSFQVKLALF